MAGSSWQRLTIDDIKAESAAAISIGPFGSRMKAELYTQTGIPVIRGKNLSACKELVGEFVYVSCETANELRSCNVFAGDLVFPHRGAIGEVGIVPRHHHARYILSTSLMKLTCNQNIVDPEFVFYFFRSPIGRYELLKNASTVGTPGIGQPLSSLRSITIHVPPLPEQQAIARILGALDDKIELNRRMNETLEGIARAIFKSWFVDFDPVRAKAEGRQPVGMDAETAAFFPSSFEDSELGEIPKGWNIRPIGEVVRVVGGSTPRTEKPEYWDGPISFATPKDLSSLKSRVLLRTERTITEVGLSQISSGLLPIGTALLSSRAPIGYLAIAELPIAVNQGFVAMICDGDVSNHFALLWAEQFMEEIKARANGTTFLEISKSSFRSISMCTPSTLIPIRCDYGVNG